MLQRRFRLIAALAASLAAPSLAQAPEPPRAPDWQPLSRSGLIAMSWDRASVVRTGDLVQVVLRAELAPGIGALAPGDFLNEIRCSDARVRVIRTTNYTPDGEPLREGSPRARFERIRPGSDEERVRAAVC